MYFDGDLESAIAFALKESKSVACFVADEAGESTIWQSQYLTDEDVTKCLREHAVLLRIEAGSQEATFLSAFHPVATIPSFVIIENGRSVLDLGAGTTRQEFRSATLKALKSVQGPSSSEAEETQQSSASESAQVINSSQNDDAVERLLADRRLRLASLEKEKQDTERAKQKARADARKDDAQQSPKSLQAQRHNWAEQQKQRKLEARAERERVLRQIESDKQERKEREERRKVASSSPEKKLSTVSNIDDQCTNIKEDTSAKHGSTQSCGLQIRLFDGKTVRGIFKSDQTISAHVRPWIDEQNPGPPESYLLQQILAPMPNRRLTESEEQATLGDLGLLPSSTLVLVRTRGSVVAQSNTLAVVAKALRSLYGAVVLLLGVVLRAVGTLVGADHFAPLVRSQADRNEAKSESVNPERTSTTTDAGPNIRTLDRSPEEHEPHELYNGNQLNFEPRKDPDE